MEEADITFLHTAAECNAYDLERAMRERKDWQSIVDRRERNALHYAALTDNLKNCQLIVKKGNISWFKADREGATPFHWAVQGGAYKVIKYIMTHVAGGAKAYLDKDKEGVTPLHIAAKRPSAKILKMLLDDAADSELAKLNKLAVDARGRSPLHYAAASASVECVQLILDSDRVGLPVDQRDRFSLTPLMCAVTIDLPQGVEVVRRLNARKPHAVNHRNQDGQTALHLAVAANNLKAIEVLLKETLAQPDQCFDNENRTPLHYAADAGHAEAVELLLGAGARPAPRDKFEVTPAHYAAQSSRRALQLLLSSARARAPGSPAPLGREEDDTPVQDIKDKEHRTCFMWAVCAGNLETMSYLLKATQPDRNETDCYGYNALHLAALMGDEAVCKELMRQGWSPDARTQNNMTALHLAAGRANADVIQTLITNSADIKLVDEYKRTPLFNACFGGKVHNLRRMIELGFEFRRQLVISGSVYYEPIRDAYGRTPLHAAAFAGHAPCIHALCNIAEEAQMLSAPLTNYRDIAGETALHVAVWGGKLECVIALHTRGALLNAIDRNGKTPMAVALERAKEEKEGKRREDEGDRREARPFEAIVNVLTSKGALANDKLVRWSSLVRLQRCYRRYKGFAQPEKYTIFVEPRLLEALRKTPASVIAMRRF